MTSRRAPKNTVSLTVPCDYVLPDWYAAASPESVAEALTLGANVIHTVRAIKSSEEIQALTAQKAEECARIRAAAAEQIATVEAALAAAEQERSAAITAATAATTTRLTAKHEAQLSEIQSNLRILQERLEALQERRHALESGRDADIRVAEERTRVLLQHTLDEKERAIIRSEKTLAALQESYNRQAEEIRALSELMRQKPTTNVKTKGNLYEDNFRAKLVVAYGSVAHFSVTHDARGHAGDWLMNFEDHTILWEVKDYDKTVPTAEVEKFHRDMRENAHVRVGVMVSRLAPITGKTSRGDREVEFIDGKMLIYLSNFESMSEDTLVNLVLLFRLWWASALPEIDTSKETAIRQVLALHGDALRAKTEWRLHKSRMDDALRWIAERVEETESRLRATLAVLQGAIATVVVPEGIFRDVAGDERATRDIQTIMKFCAAEHGCDCTLNELADVFSKEIGISKDTAKSHIRAVILDSCILTPKGKPTRILGLKMLPLET